MSEYLQDTPDTITLTITPEHARRAYAALDYMEREDGVAFSADHDLLFQAAFDLFGDAVQWSGYQEFELRDGTIYQAVPEHESALSVLVQNALGARRDRLARREVLARLPLTVRFQRKVGAEAAA
jgi:hypothetical protein